MPSLCFVLSLAVFATPIIAQQAAYGQCGGSGWSGQTTCVSGYTCTVNNEWYSQCVPSPAGGGGGAATTTASSPAPTSGSGGGSNSAGLWWFGVNLSGAEFGETTIPGTYGKEYYWYNKAAIDQLYAKGMNMFRVNFLMERLTPTLTGGFDTYYLSNLTDTINYITSKGAYAMVQPHNYGRFNKNIITDTAGFQTWWKNVAAQYKSNKLVVFDTNNEYHDMDQTLVFNLNQAAIDGIRAAGATTQYITPEGNMWSGAWSWVSSGNAASLINLKDPSNKLIFQMHQYLDVDSSGSHTDCTSTTIFQERLVAATTWLRQNKQMGLIGEFAAGPNAQCITALQGGLAYLKANKDVWTGALWWAAGPWWGTTTPYSMEPPTGQAFTDILPSIISYWK